MTEELTHSGIPGMKWGNRRFQYEDGTLTPEGRRRYLKNPDERRGEGEQGVTIAKPKRQLSKSELRKREKAKKKKAAAEAAEKKKREIEENRRNNILLDPNRLSKNFNNPKYNYTEAEVKRALERFKIEDQIMDLAKKRATPPPADALAKGKKAAETILSMMRMGVDAYEKYVQFQNLVNYGSKDRPKNDDNSGGGGSSKKKKKK